MKRDEIQTLVRQSHQRPFRICMTDGQSYTISHPDFAAVANSALIVLAGPGHELGPVDFVICSYDQIARIEQLQNEAKQS